MPYKNLDERRAYNRKYLKMRRHTDPVFKARQLASGRRSKAIAQARCKAIVAEWQAEGCALCRENEPACLTFHHRDSKQKDIGISKAINFGRSEEKLLAELKKCICLCANCHRKVHAGHLEIPANGG